MAYLTICNLIVPVEVGSSKMRTDAISTRQRSADGQMNDTRRGTRRRWDATACYGGHREAISLQRLIMGDGHRFSWENGIDAQTGLHFDTIEDVKIGEIGSDKFLSFETGSAQAIVNPKLGDEWTIAYVIKGSPNKVVMHKRENAVETIYVDGVLNNSYWASTALTPTVDDGFFALTSSATGPGVMDLAIFYFAFADSFMQRLTLAGGPFCDFPILDIGGDMVDGKPIKAIGEIKDSNYERVSGENNDFKVSFVLNEYDETHRSPF